MAKTLTAQDLNLGKCGEGTYHWSATSVCGKRARWEPLRRGIRWESPEGAYRGQWGWRCGTHSVLRGVEDQWARNKAQQARQDAFTAQMARRTFARTLVVSALESGDPADMRAALAVAKEFV